MHHSLAEAELRSSFTDYDAFLPKPCSSRLLRESIDKILKRS